MRPRFLLFLVLCVPFYGEQGRPGRGPALKPLLACGQHGDIQVICGADRPEDIELAPDGKHLILTQYRGRNGPSHIQLFDLEKQTFANIPQIDAHEQNWGDPACTGFLGDDMGAHGIGLAKRKDGKWQLNVVNHASRESIEIFELRSADRSWQLAWHGCVSGGKASFNDVTILPQGGFVATRPLALQETLPAGAPPVSGDVLDGRPTGYVSIWESGKGLTDLPNTTFAYPNGVLVSKDGKTIWYNTWTGHEIHKYDLRARKEVAVIKLDFGPDNLTWTPGRKMLAAGIGAIRGQCPPDSGVACSQVTRVAELDPETMKITDVFTSKPAEPLLNSTSVAFELKNGDIYLGAPNPDRLIKIKRKK